jgi:hypothetical protein
MRAENFAIVKCAINISIGGAGGALRNCPFRAGVILRLHRAEPLHHLLGFREWLVCEVLAL